MKRDRPPGARMTLCGTSPRAYAKHLGGTLMKFFYPCGYSNVRDYSKGKVSKRLQEGGCKMMGSWWSKEKGGVIAECPRCRRAAVVEVQTSKRSSK
jgi:hypothetical protein